MEDQAIRRRTRILDAGALRSSQREERYVAKRSLSEQNAQDRKRSLEEENEKRAPITVKFEIPYFTVSGIQVRYLKIVEKSGYQALPWVRCVLDILAPRAFPSQSDAVSIDRYITQHGDDYRYELQFALSVLPNVL